MVVFTLVVSHKGNASIKVESNYRDELGKNLNTDEAAAMGNINR